MLTWGLLRSKLVAHRLHWLYMLDVARRSDEGLTARGWRRT